MVHSDTNLRDVAGTSQDVAERAAGEARAEAAVGRHPYQRPTVLGAAVYQRGRHGDPPEYDERLQAHEGQPRKGRALDEDADGVVLQSQHGALCGHVERASVPSRNSDI